MRVIGPNHADGCTGANWRHSGDGYNRVRVCACGAEDHDPTVGALQGMGSGAGISLRINALESRLATLLERVERLEQKP